MDDSFCFDNLPPHEIDWLLRADESDLPEDYAIRAAGLSLASRRSGKRSASDPDPGPDRRRCLNPGFTSRWPN